MSIGKVAVLAVALIFASGGVGAALADWSDPDVDLVDEDARKDDAVDVELAVEEEDDSNDRGPAGVNQAPGAQGDGDNTAGNDGTAGGDNTEAAPAPAPQPVPAGAADDTADSGAGLGAGGAAGGAGDDTDGGAGAGAGGAGGGGTEDGGSD